jgi:hypothetical protein
MDLLRFVQVIRVEEDTRQSSQWRSEPMIPPVEVSRMLLLALVAAGALAAIATREPTSSFAGGFAAGAGAAFVVSFLSNPRRGRAKEGDGESP